MERALLCGNSVKATWVATLADEEFTKIRSEFTCVGCKARVYFNKGSRHQGPYFASKSHADDCDEAYQGFSGSDPALVDSNTIVLMIGGSVGASSNANADKDTRSRRRTTISKDAETAEVRIRRGVDAILQELLVNPDFAISSKKIVVGKVETSASEFFVPFLQLGPQHIDRPIGVWGEASSFRELTSVAFLNRGDQKPDIRIPSSVFKKLKELYRFTSDTELEGTKFLLVGTFNFLLRSDVLDARQIALQIPSP
jgi:hypothetical protein